jgi:SOS-response transcriptional repressor LexA
MNDRASVFCRNMMNHLNRLNAGKNRKNWVTAYKIALEVGMDPTHVTNIFQGRRKGTPETLAKIAQSRLLQLEYALLRSWQLQDDYEPDVLKAFIRSNELQPVPGPSRFVRVPCRGEVFASGLRFFESSEDPAYYEWWDLEDFPPDEQEKLYCFKVIGHSMWPPVPEGSLILVREVFPANGFKAGRWYVILTETGEATFKMVEFEAETARLVPLNPAFPPIELTAIQLSRSFEVIKYQVCRINN